MTFDTAKTIKEENKQKKTFVHENECVQKVSRLEDGLGAQRTQTQTQQSPSVHQQEWLLPSEGGEKEKVLRWHSESLTGSLPQPGVETPPPAASRRHAHADTLLALLHQPQTPAQMETG